MNKSDLISLFGFLAVILAAQASFFFEGKHWARGVLMTLNAFCCSAHAAFIYLSQ
jgi:hypothetical protein